MDLLIDMDLSEMSFEKNEQNAILKSVSLVNGKKYLVIKFIGICVERKFSKIEFMYLDLEAMSNCKLIKG